MGGKVSHNFKIEEWNDRGGINDTIAECSNFAVACAAFDAACQEKPGREITLRQGALVIKSQKAS